METKGVEMISVNVVNKITGKAAFTPYSSCDLFCYLNKRWTEAIHTLGLAVNDSQL